VSNNHKKIHFDLSGAHLVDPNIKAKFFDFLFIRVSLFSKVFAHALAHILQQLTKSAGGYAL